MRTASRWIATFLFILLLPTWLLLLVPKLNSFGPDAIKQEFASNDVYPKLSAILQQSNFDETAEGSLDGDATNQALVLFRSALTPEYLQTKTETILEDGSEWVTGVSNEAPEVSFNDIRDQVVSAYPAAQIQIDELQSELSSARDAIDEQNVSSDGVPGLSGDGSASSEEIAELLAQADSLDNFTSGDFTINLANAAEPVKQGYWYYWMGMPLFGVGLFLLLVAIFFLGRNWISRTRWTGWTLITAAIVNMILSVAFSILVLKIGLDMISGFIPGQAEVAGSITRSLSNAIFADYIQLELILSSILLGVGVILLIASLIIQKRTRATHAITPEIDLTPEAQQPGASKYAHTS